MPCTTDRACLAELAEAVNEAGQDSDEALVSALFELVDELIRHPYHHDDVRDGLILLA